MSWFNGEVVIGLSAGPAKFSVRPDGLLCRFPLENLPGTRNCVGLLSFFLACKLKREANG